MERSYFITVALVFSSISPFRYFVISPFRHFAISPFRVLNTPEKESVIMRGIVYFKLQDVGLRD